LVVSEEEGLNIANVNGRKMKAAKAFASFRVKAAMMNAKKHYVGIFAYIIRKYPKIGTF
jgi:hypothetical protein